MMVYTCLTQKHVTDLIGSKEGVDIISAVLGHLSDTEWGYVIKVSLNTFHQCNGKNFQKVKDIFCVVYVKRLSDRDLKVKFTNASPKTIICLISRSKVKEVFWLLGVLNNYYYVKIPFRTVCTDIL